MVELVHAVGNTTVCIPNFVRIHRSLKVSPAMAAKVTDKLWEIGDTVKVLEDWEAARV
jgi:hypothetical protein